jgi:hypothetical protein
VFMLSSWSREALVVALVGTGRSDMSIAIFSVVICAEGICAWAKRSGHCLLAVVAAECTANERKTIAVDFIHKDRDIYSC